MELKKLMIFDDFTEAANIAAQHCYQIAALSKAEVVSLHVVSDNEDLDWAEKKCVEQIKKMKNYDESVPFQPLATKLNLFQGMNKWLEERNIDITFMATHGKKDIQFLTGSHALKLIFNAEIPTMVVQHKTPLRPYRNILLPVFGHQNEMQFPINALKSIGELFGAKLMLLTPASKDAAEKEEIQQTVAWLRSGLVDSFSAINVKESNQSEKNLSKAVSAAIGEGNFDLIAIVIGAKHHRDISEKNKKFIQSIITNEEHLPVLCL
jgi:hypothetical protein